MLNNAKLDKVKQEFSVFNNVVNVVKQAVIDFGKAMVQTLAKIAAQKAIASIFGGAFSQGGEVGEVKNFSQGGKVAEITDVANFANGGIITNKAVRRAMTREGQGAIPVVAHKGEYILSTRNGDSQLFQALRRNGKWREIKQQYHVPNYALGGVVGSSRASAGSYNNNNSGRNRGNVTINNTYNTSVANVNQMRKTQDQLIAAAEARNARIKARNS